MGQNIEAETESVYPKKSSRVYEKRYQTFMEWCKDNDINNYTENVFLKYFCERADSVKSSTLWSLYSMLKATFRVNHNIDLSGYRKLLAFIKQQSRGYRPKKSSTFTQEHIYTFLTEAGDKKFLMWKVILVIGVAGGCRMDELKSMTIDNIQDKGNILVFTIPDSRTGKIRTFTVTDKMCEDYNPIVLYKKYRCLRPAHTSHKRLFIFYRHGKCTPQPVGIHTFGKIPSLIATYLKLPDPTSFTGHALRKTSEILSANTSSFVLNFSQRGKKNETIVIKEEVDAVNSIESDEELDDNENSDVTMRVWDENNEPKINEIENDEDGNSGKFEYILLKTESDEAMGINEEQPKIFIKKIEDLLPQIKTKAAKNTTPGKKC